MIKSKADLTPILMDDLMTKCGEMRFMTEKGVSEKIYIAITA
jgi:hypothetical protein